MAQPSTSNLQSLGDLLTQSTQQQYSIPQMLEEAITRKIGKDAPLFQQRERALKEFIAAPSQAQEEFARPINYQASSIPELGEFNRPGAAQTYLPPLAQNRLVQERVAAKYAPLATLNDLIYGMQGGIQNIIEKTGKAFEGRTVGFKAQFDAAAKLEELRQKGEEFEQKKEEKRKKEAVSIDDIQGTIDKVGEVEAVLKSTKEDITGFWPGLKLKFGKGLSRKGLLGRFLAPGESTANVSTAISNYNTSLFEIAGKAFTGPEKNILQGLLLEPGEDEVFMQDKINRARFILQNKLAKEISQL